MRDREAQDAIQKKVLEEITTILEQLALVSKESESGAIMNAHEFIKYELEFDLNNPYIPPKEEIIGMFIGEGDATDNDLIEEADNVQISEVVVDRVGFKYVDSDLETIFRTKTF